MWLVSSSLLLRPSLNTRTATDIKISRKSNYATLKIWMGDKKKKHGMAASNYLSLRCCMPVSLSQAANHLHTAATSSSSVLLETPKL
jgi:hypothetical protein